MQSNPNSSKQSQQTSMLKQMSTIVYNILNKEKLLRGEWHHGDVDTVISSTSIRVFVDGSSISQIIPCNPDVTFKSGDKVFVHFVNGNSSDKFVPYKRGI